MVQTDYGSAWSRFVAPHLRSLRSLCEERVARASERHSDAARALAAYDCIESRCALLADYHAAFAAGVLISRQEKAKPAPGVMSINE